MLRSIICSYSRTITQWLIKRFPGEVSLDSSGANNDEIIPVLQLLLPTVEFQACTQGHFNLPGRIKQLSGVNSRKAQLSWLLDLFDQSDLPDPVKDELYDQLKVFVKWDPGSSDIDQANLPVSIIKQPFAGRPIRALQSAQIIRNKIESPLTLSSHEKSCILDAMKLSLTLRYRETDPVTFADPDELELFEMGRGLHIALVGMQKHKRLSLESYIGYMAFRNGVPTAYGGGWLWGQRCRIGISIYPEFRKAESAWVFSQVLRLYYQHFNARHFIIRANQFGKGNHDGLKSGAFWFYYKLGFRPASSELGKLAATEWKKIRANRNYRSTLTTLRSFITAPLEWTPDKTGTPVPDAETISEKISETINREFGGSRIRAFRSMLMKLRRDLQPVSWQKLKNHGASCLDNGSLLLTLLPGFSNWSRTDKRKLVELIQAKQEGNERVYILGMQKFRTFWKAL